MLYHLLPTGRGQRAEEGASWLQDLPALLPAGRRPAGSVLGTVQEGVRQGPHPPRLHPRGQSGLSTFDPAAICLVWPCLLVAAGVCFCLLNLFLLSVLVLVAVQPPTCRFVRAARQRRSASAASTSSYRRTAPSPSSMARHSTAWIWWPIQLRWPTSGSRASGWTGGGDWDQRSRSYCVL